MVAGEPLVVAAMPDTPAAAYTSTVSGVPVVSGSTQLPISPLARLAGLSLSTLTEGFAVSMRMSLAWPSEPALLLTATPLPPLTPALVVA